ncbi:acyltransferase family protein [Desertibaculum subflavum]|uniref:acyltransferase family protein n=1 Tax=Desertibaculum subflavum TaxID=2268458 RepID=UPI0013C52C18
MDPYFRNGPAPDLVADAPARHYDALDLLRGVAALVVCLYHVAFLFVDSRVLFDSGFLCVDMFFMLSGFVIAANYDRKIAAGQSLRQFAIDRLARLYPLFALTTVIGFLAVNAQQLAKFGLVDGDKVIATLLANLVMVPSFFAPWDVRSVFPFNGATWSIFFELWVNILFFLAWKQLDAKRIRLLVAASGLALIGSSLAFGTLDLGWGRANFGHGFIRVMFSFFLGVLIFRSGIAERLKVRGLWALLALLPLAAALNARAVLPESLGAISDIVIVFLIFPAMLILFAAADLPPAAKQVAFALGGASYAIYLLQTPLVILFSGLPPLLLGQKVAELAPFAGFVFVPLLLAASYVTWRAFELPAKNWIRRALRPAPAVSPTA